MLRLGLLLFFAAFAALACAVPLSQTESDAVLVVDTDLGAVQGSLSAQGDVREFKGIPYAKAPVGGLRFASPVSAEPYSQVPFDATKWAPGCPQKCVLPPGTCPEVTSEDCLTLNVFAPANSSDISLLPVMVFLPGGRFMQGSAGTILYDGEAIASKDVVLVTVSYRLGVLGFMYEADSGVLGNMGIKDQRLAMQWVRRNILAFGGNPAQVTLFGQSAGAISVATHMVSPLSEGLFHRAILQSEPYTISLHNTKIAKQYSDRVFKFLGCNKPKSPEERADCLRSKTADEIVEAQHSVSFPMWPNTVAAFMPWMPVVDGIDVPTQPLTTFETDGFSVPVIVGTMSRDADMFIYGAYDKDVTKTAYKLLLTAVFGTKAHSVYKQYPDSVKDARPIASEMATKYIFECDLRRLASGAANKHPVFRYQWNHACSFDAFGPRYPECNGVACHGAELPFIFGSAEVAGFNLTEAEQQLSHAGVSAWTDFAKADDLSSMSFAGVNWPQAVEKGAPILQVNAGNYTVDKKLDSSICDFWNSIGYLTEDGMAISGME